MSSDLWKQVSENEFEAALSGLKFTTETEVAKTQTQFGNCPVTDTFLVDGNPVARQWSSLGVYRYYLPIERKVNDDEK